MMAARPPVLIRMALGLVRLIGRVVPRAHRRDWQREWESELTQHESADDAHWTGQVRVLGRSTGALADAAWLRRQFTTDSEWAHDVRHAWRQSIARPRFFLLIVAVLAVGIGSTTAVATVLDRIVIRPLPFPEPHTLVALWQLRAHS
jgi:hypothetical protein